MDKNENRKGVANFINFFMHIIIFWFAFKMAHIKAIEPKKICRSQNGPREILKTCYNCFQPEERPWHDCVSVIESIADTFNPDVFLRATQ